MTVKLYNENMSNNLKILVVEDEEMLLNAIGTKIELAEMTPILCSSGSKGLEYLTNNELPDVIWLDYNLTDMDGLAFMAKVEDDPRLKEIPIIVVSNSASQEKVNAMMLKGAKKYLVKAENKLSEIIDIVKKYAGEQEDTDS